VILTCNTLLKSKVVFVNISYYTEVTWTNNEPLYFIY